MSMLFEGQGNPNWRRKNKDNKGLIPYHARRLEWQEQRFSLRRPHRGLFLQSLCPHRPISSARPCRSRSSSLIPLHFLLLLFLPPTPFPSLPFLRRPIRRRSALLIFFDLLRLLLLSRPRRRRVLPINVSDGSLIPVCSASPSFSPVWMPGIGFSFKYLRMEYVAQPQSQKKIATPTAK